MSQLVRLVYASRSTFTPAAGHQGLDPGVARILAKSRKNNASRGIVGALLFGDGCFLQCLEGNETDVDALYETIRADHRHRDVTVLSRRTIDRTSFGAWSMKYAPGEAPLRRFMRSVGMNHFDPYAMSPQSIDAAVAWMERDAEPMPGAERDDSSGRSAETGLDDTQPSGRSTEPAGSTKDGNTSAGKAPRLIIGLLLLGALLLLGFLARRA